jgi:hypothetical protein
MAKTGEPFSAQSRRVIIRLVLEHRLIPTSTCHACCSGADHVPQANRLANAYVGQLPQDLQRPGTCRRAGVSGLAAPHPAVAVVS